MSLSCEGRWRPQPPVVTVRDGMPGELDALAELERWLAEHVDEFVRGAQELERRLLAAR